MQQTSDPLRGWFAAAWPLCPELFNAAYAMCGNYDLAEYALRSALMDVWLQGASGGVGFRERLRAALRREAFDAALSEEGLSAEFTWPGVPPREGDAVQTLLSREPVETQRLVMLRHGCGLSPRAVAQLTGMTPGQARGALERFEARVRRGLPDGGRGRAEAAIARRAKKLLGRDGPDTPQPAQLYRAFEAEASGVQATGHRASRVIGSLLLALTALLCAGTFWLFAVLVRPV